MNSQTEQYTTVILQNGHHLCHLYTYCMHNKITVIVGLLFMYATVRLHLFDIQCIQ